MYSFKNVKNNLKHLKTLLSKFKNKFHEFCNICKKNIWFVEIKFGKLHIPLTVKYSK